MREGDYVQVTHRFPPLIRRGTRGTVEHMEGEFALVRRYDAEAFWVPLANLAVIDRGLDL